MTHELKLEQLVGFLGTWSGSICYRTQTGREATDEIRDDLVAAWGDSEQVREVAWDLFMRVGRIGGR